MRPCFPDQLLMTKLLLGVDMPHAPQQLATFWAFHQQAADQLGGNLLGRAGKKALGEVLGRRGGYGSGLEMVGDYWEEAGICSQCINTQAARYKVFRSLVNLFSRQQTTIDKGDGTVRGL